ncbi:CvpA family protein [Brachymonas sp. M4Q-1]|uniref:CvpA family protein n=1 Tax=Brachymonas sp. M4Q-1 TaxID=3416906 RepID=UPI003CED8FFE
MSGAYAFWQHLGTWDAICLVVVVCSAMLGLWRGLVHEVMSLAGWVLAFLAANWSAEMVRMWLPEVWLSHWSPEAGWLLAFALVFMIVMLGMAFLSSFLGSLLKSVGMGAIDKVLGGGFGLIRGVVLLWIVTIAVLLTPLHTSMWWQRSLASVWLTGSLHQVAPWLPVSFEGWVPPAVGGSRPRPYERGA